MHVGFDAKRALQNTTGLGSYGRNVLRILAQRRPGHRYVAFGPAPTVAPLPEGVEHRGPDTALGRLAPSLWRLAGLTAQLRREGIQLFHGLASELPLGVERSGARTVVTVHDLIFERFPQFYASVDRRIYAWKVRSAVARADRIIAISEQTRRDLVELYGVSPDRIRVVYQGCHPAFQVAPCAGSDEAVARRLALPEGYLLSVGTVERRKNLGLVVKALARLPRVPLLVVGRETGYAAEVRQEARRLGVEGRVRYLKGLTVEELAAVYRRATAFVYPSRYEGFGIPIIEALFAGLPVVTTAGGVFPEAGGPGSAYVDPDDVDGLRGTLAALLADQDRRQAMRESGLRHALRFTDAAVAEGLSSIYRELGASLDAPA